MNECRKDCSPRETVKKIKRILNENKIKIKEYKVKNIYKKFYSVRIEIKGFYNIGTNGKGLSKELALASAYAELMERLQSHMLINTYYLNKVNNYINYYDETSVEVNRNINNRLIKSFFEKDVNIQDFLKNNEKYNHTSNYVNLISNKIELLPSKLINATSFSNGLCAGNSYYEAINQGICEIFERYSYREILFNKISLNTIILDNNLPVCSRINHLESKGFNIQIKDCTLGIFPVVGVYITNKEKNKYIFTIGCDPNLNIAIERCITEAFQGLNDDNQIINKMKPINNNYDNLTYYDKNTNWLKNYSSNDGIHPNELFNSKTKIHYRKIKCFNNLNNNKDIYDYLLKIIKNNNYSIYIKDFSYLGFNTYKIFIPNISNIEPINTNEKDIIKNFDLIKEIFFNLDNFADTQKLIKASSIIEKILNNNKYSFIKLGSYFHSNNYIKTFYNDITFELLYILINYKLNNEVDLKHIKNKKLTDYIKSINCANKYDFIKKDLKLILPSCPNCKACKLKQNCKYKNWLKINNILKSKEKAFHN